MTLEVAGQLSVHQMETYPWIVEPIPDEKQFVKVTYPNKTLSRLYLGAVLSVLTPFI